MPVRDSPDEAISCTRAGLLIIIICGLGLSLLRPIEVRIVLKDLERYITLRLALAAHLGEVERTTFVSNKVVSLAALTRSDCFKNYKDESNPAIQAISALLSLNNTAQLEKARRGYYLNDYSIYRWKLRLNSALLAGNNYDNITFRSVKELSDFEYPDMSQYEDLFRRNVLLDTQWTPISVRLDHAVVFIELGLLIALAYFWLLFLEATYSGTSKRQGTIFMAASRTGLTRSLAFVFLACPSIIVGLLLIYSYPLGDAAGLKSAHENIGVNALLLLAIIFMSGMIWMTAQIDWRKKSRTC